MVRRPTSNRYTSKTMTADETAHDRANDTKQHRDDNPAGVSSGHQQFRDRTDNKTQNYPPENAEHTCTSAAFVALRVPPTTNEPTNLMNPDEPVYPQ